MSRRRRITAETYRSPHLGAARSGHRWGFNLLEPSFCGQFLTVPAGQRIGRLLEPSFLGQILTVPAGQRIGRLLEPSLLGLQPARTVTAGASTCSNRHCWGFNLLEPSLLGLQPARTVTSWPNFDGSSRSKDRAPARTVTAGASTCSNRHRWGFNLLEPSLLGQILTVSAGLRVGRVMRHHATAPCNGTMQRHHATAPCNGTMQRHLQRERLHGFYRG